MTGAIIDGELGNGERLPLMRLRYGGSVHRWGAAIYAAGTGKYEDQVWFAGTTEDIFDLVRPVRDQRLTDHQHTHIGTVNPRRNFGVGHLACDLTSLSVFVVCGYGLAVGRTLVLRPVL
jgi:hypothetical protein